MSVINIIRKIKEKDREIRLLILGLDNAGKTTVLKRILNEDINTISPTVGFNIKTIQYSLPTNQPTQHIDDSENTRKAQHQLPSNSTSSLTQYNVTIWDIGGQSTIRSCWSNYFTNTDGLVWVVDTTDVSRFQLCYESLKQVLKQEKLSGVSVLIFANKQDMAFSCTLEEIRAMLRLDELLPPSVESSGESDASEISSSQHHWFIYGCSARDNIGIQEGFDALLRDIIQRMYMFA